MRIRANVYMRELEEVGFLLSHTTPVQTACMAVARMLTLQPARELADARVVHVHVFNTLPEMHPTHSKWLLAHFAPRSVLSLPELQSIVARHANVIAELRVKLTPHYIHIDLRSYPLVYTHVATVLPVGAEPQFIDVFASWNPNRALFAQCNGQTVFFGTVSYASL